MRFVGVLLFACAASLITSAFSYYQNQDRKQVIALAAENERLRLFNARELRRLDKKKKGSPNLVACASAEHDLGIPSIVIQAVWYHENGPPDIETGILGKTAWISSSRPMSDWPAYEAARTMNIYAWKWLIKTPKGRVALKEILRYAAIPYTANTRPDAWANNIYGKIVENDLP